MHAAHNGPVTRTESIPSRPNSHTLATPQPPTSTLVSTKKINHETPSVIRLPHTGGENGESELVSSVESTTIGNTRHIPIERVQAAACASSTITVGITAKAAAKPRHQPNQSKCTNRSRQ